MTPAREFALGVAQAIAEADEADELVRAQERIDWEVSASNKFAVCLCRDGVHNARSWRIEQYTRAADAVLVKSHIASIHPTAHVIALLATALP